VSKTGVVIIQKWNSRRRRRRPGVERKETILYSSERSAFLDFKGGGHQKQNKAITQRNGWNSCMHAAPCAHQSHCVFGRGDLGARARATNPRENRSACDFWCLSLICSCVTFHCSLARAPKANEMDWGAFPTLAHEAESVSSGLFGTRIQSSWNTNLESSFMTLILINGPLLKIKVHWEGQEEIL